MKTLFKNAQILIRDVKEYKVLSNAYLGINNDVIEYIGEEEPSDTYDVIKDMNGKLLMPGLVNSHCHLPMTLLRSVGTGLKLQDWLTKAIFPLEDQFTPSIMEAGTALACLEMIRGGTTTFSEMYFMPYRETKAIAKSGLKCNFGLCGVAFDETAKAEDIERYHDIIDLMECFKKDSSFTPNRRMLDEVDEKQLDENQIEAIKEGRIVSDITLHSDYLSTKNMVSALAELNKKYNAAVQVHISETEKDHNECIQRYGLTPVQYYKSLGLFDSGSAYVAHCVYVTDEDLQIMKDNNVTLVHCPSSNMKLGSGIAPITKAINMGINVAIGTDGCASNDNLDLFEEMKIAALLQTGINKDPSCISVTNILDMATINGAKALRRFDTGKLEVGYKADIIAIDMKKPHLKPATNIPAMIVYSMNASDVCMTMVDGKILFEDNKYLSLDEEEVYQKVEKATKELGI